MKRIMVIIALLAISIVANAQTALYKHYANRQGIKAYCVERYPLSSGDIVTVMVGGKLPHIMIVSDRKSAAGVPLAIHNIGAGTQEEDVLFAYPMTGHYRIP